MKIKIKKLKQEIHKLLEDELLQDIPEIPTVNKLNDLIAVEKGTAFNVIIDRKPLASIDLIVHQSDTVKDLKNKLRDKIRYKSWKYIWRTYCLELNNQKLLNDNLVMSQLGIKQNTLLTFSRLPFEKGSHRKAWKRPVLSLYAGDRV